MLANQARLFGLVPLVEVHSDEDIAKLRYLDWELVGVNNRDLRTFQVDLDHSIAVAQQLPSGVLRVAESGIGNRDQLLRLSRAGFDAFLVGESLLLAPDPKAKLAELLGDDGSAP